jgi:transposase-like protein
MDFELFFGFRDEQSAYHFVEACVWSEGRKCPHCGGRRRTGRLRGQSTPAYMYKCYHCRKLFNVRSGTIFESTHVPLHKWLQAMYLCGCGTEPRETQRLSDVLNVSFKTSAAMIKRMTRAAALGGVMPDVDADESAADLAVQRAEKGTRPSAPARDEQLDIGTAALAPADGQEVVP